MKYLSLLFIIFFMVSCKSPNKAQSSEKISSKAQKLFNEAVNSYRTRQYDEALQLADKAIAKHINYSEAYLLKAEIYNTQQQYLKALESYEKVIEIKPTSAPGVYLSLAQCEFIEGLYQDAVSTLTDLQDQHQLNKALQEKTDALLLSAKFAATAINNPKEFNPENLGENVNTAEADYHPCVTIDENTLIFTRKIPAGTDRYGNLQYQEDFYISNRTDTSWSVAKSMGHPLNTSSNEGAQSISMDGRFMYFTACHRPDGQGSCDIYRSFFDGQSWQTPENLGKPINSNKWDSQPSISADGRTLYFVSAREGGVGEKDIWVSVLNQQGQWTQPEPASFNTKGNELSPFIHPDGQTLFFASDGLPGMGGFDIYFVRKDENGQWSTPVNIGYPINTYNDEHGLIVNPKGDRAYFATDREETIGKLDIYSFLLYEEARPKMVGYAKGIVRDIYTKKGLPATIEIVDLNTEEVVATSLSNANDGTYLMALPTQKNYAANVTSKGYLFHSEQFTLKSENTIDYLSLVIDLQPIEIGSTVVLKNIFFETGSFQLKSESKAELNKLVTFLNNNATLKIEIGGHTDNVGSASDNQILSENRAKAVYNYLLKKEIPMERLSFKGYGQNKPIDTNATEQGRANNRRTEFTVIGR